LTTIVLVNPGNCAGGWILQWYGKLPACMKVNSKVPPAALALLRLTPFEGRTEYTLPSLVNR
jgi:hypothetical protein